MAFPNVSAPNPSLCPALCFEVFPSAGTLALGCVLALTVQPFVTYLWGSHFLANGIRYVKNQMFPDTWSLVVRTEEAHTDYNVTKHFIQKQSDNTDQSMTRG